ncbi:MAG: Root adhesin [Candidatus Accumulibacter regalis]|jgi:OOP family OmpA-OmpF porin|uniref:Root adhesin n=2 Tax=Candidatus Accumulibacter TaxID=327159 RepID=A0A011QE02_ACCRE|nr:OmpA family protein [Accumulibacter sp.]EXI76983.1 MAG: Root adhesin [Candidatus Accumulibacter appositus]EXI87552.1 MAG: Root adhesin [Candidatus Accumulibacter regalis]MBN8512865.1 OmpA family protein [Accumulibacter sp.]MBO3704601.1 OmpA family protein [Accumulibacter sp.]HRE69579.1 OmpA family protein [Accumulibacter sp.]
MRIAGRLCGLALLLSLSGCAPISDRVVLLPGPDGRSGAVLVSTGQEEKVLSEAYADARVAGGRVSMQKTSAGMVRDDYGALLAMQPARPRLFVVHFDAGTSRLTPASRALLAGIRSELATLPAGEAVVIGHTDRVGAVDANDRLSLQRAALVRDLLVSAGIAPAAIAVVGRGERAPAVVTADEVAEARNRRVEIKLR